MVGNDIKIIFDQFKYSSTMLDKIRQSKSIINYNYLLESYLDII